MNPYQDQNIITRYETTTESNNTAANIIPTIIPKTNSVISINLDTGIKIGIIVVLAALTIYLLKKKK